MSTEKINRWVFEIPLEDVRDENYEESRGDNPCFLCGKQVKNVKYYVHYLNSGNLVSTDQEFSELEEMGMFPIGNNCKNKLPNNFYFHADKI